MDTINKKIKEYRKLCGHTQAYMAEKMGITQSAYSQFENNEGDSMRVSTLKNFCEVFDVDANWLLGLDAKPKISARDLAVLRTRGKHPESAALKVTKAKHEVGLQKHKYEIKD